MKKFMLMRMLKVYGKIIRPIPLIPHSLLIEDEKIV